MQDIVDMPLSRRSKADERYKNSCTFLELSFLNWQGEDEPDEGARGRFAMAFKDMNGL